MYKVLIVADELDSLQIETDSTLRMIEEMCLRQEIFQVYYCDYSKLNLDIDAQNFVKKIPCQNILYCNPQDANFIGLDIKQHLSLEAFDLVMLRQDPPVDSRFVKCCLMFNAGDHSKTLFVNHPKWIAELKEHVIPTEYPEYAIPTHVCSSLNELIDAVRKQRPEAVLKPENESSGIGIKFVPPSCSESDLNEYYKKYGPNVIVQPYLEEITKSGDLRVLFMNGKILGSVLRVPQKGSRLANFYQGGSAAKLDANPRQIEICQNVGKDLANKGIYFIGFDFIGDQLSEVNITSPTGMSQINTLNNVNIQKDFVDEIVRLLEKNINKG